MKRATATMTRTLHMPMTTTAKFDDANDTTMSPKNKPATLAATAVVAKMKAAATTLKTARDDDANISQIPAPCMKYPTKPFYLDLDVHDTGFVAYYTEEGVNYANVEMHKNGCQMKS